jgi:ferredoxin
MDTDNPQTVRKVRTLTVRIDRSLCIGAATCVALAPKAFALDNEAKAIFLETTEDELDQAIIDAAKGCPVAAITITDETGKEIAP